MQRKVLPYLHAYGEKLWLNRLPHLIAYFTPRCNPLLASSQGEVDQKKTYERGEYPFHELQPTAWSPSQESGARSDSDEEHSVNFRVGYWKTWRTSAPPVWSSNKSSHGYFFPPSGLIDAGPYRMWYSLEANTSRLQAKVQWFGYQVMLHV